METQRDSITWWQRQRREQCSCKPRNATECRQTIGRWKRQGGVSCRVSEEHSAADTLVSDFWAPGLWDNNFPVFQATHSIVLCYGRPRNEYGCTARICNGPRSSHAKAKMCTSKLRCVPTYEQCAFWRTVTIQMLFDLPWGYVPINPF